MATKAKCPGKVVNGKCIGKDGKEITAPYISEKGAFYPDQKSLNSGCAKNPNGPGCKAIIDKMTPEQRAKIAGLQKLGGATKKTYKTGGITKYNDGGIADLKEVTVTAKKKKKYKNNDAASSKVRPVDDKTTKQASKYKTGGMVNANAKLKATAKAGSKGVKPGVNPKAAASSTAKKPSKPRSKAPKKATPGRG
jgi:hypothetical protein